MEFVGINRDAMVGVAPLPVLNAVVGMERNAAGGVGPIVLKKKRSAAEFFLIVEPC